MDTVQVLVYVGRHGIARRRVSAYPDEVTLKMMDVFQDGGAAINQLSTVFGCSFTPYLCGNGRASADFTRRAALSSQEFYRALRLGMTTVDPKANVVCLGETGIGNTTAASALCYALFDQSIDDWIGRGSGIDDQGLERKKRVIQEGVTLHRGKSPLSLLQSLGGYELAALAGAIIQARTMRIPVILDGFVVAAVAAVLFAISSDALRHCVSSHLSQEKGHQRLLTLFNHDPILNLNLRLGEGSGAALVIPLLRGAVACYRHMFSLSMVIK